MSILKEHLKRNCDARMVGVLSLSIREAYRYLMELTERESIFQRAEMKKVWGHVRHGLVDVGLKQVLTSSAIPHEIADKASSRYVNGHTYLMIETKGAILTPAKVLSEASVPKKALFRNRGSLLNKQYNLFDKPEDLNEYYDANQPLFLLLTYGGSNHQLRFVRLGLPDIGVGRWIDQIDITQAPVLLKNPEEVRKDLHLTFTSTADELIRRGLENEREVDF